jgi:transcriptional regulator with XRE-family HTH domain
MRRIRRPPAVVTGLREARAIAANLGRDTRSTRNRRRLTQQALGQLVGLGQSEISYLERGNGSRTSIETWVAIGIALGRPVAIGFARDVVDPLQDARHLAAQELVIRLGRGGGWRAAFEAPVDPRMTGLSTDLVLRRPRGPTVLVEIWNRLDDLGAAVRSSDRKVAAYAEPRRDARPAALLWLLVDTAANRAIVRRYPAIVRSRFPGSSSAWVRAVVTSESPPRDPGIAWVDVTAGRIRELRLSAEG